jgi:glutamate-1-semialdehyde 2,1-aminomutase
MTATSIPPLAGETDRFARSEALRIEAHDLIPGGSHTYAKGDDQYPVLAPGFIARGEGCHVWDVDGNEFIEYGMGLRAVTLGHGYRPVIDAAYRAMLQGMNFTRPAALEVECAREFLNLVTTAEMVKFAKNGSDTTTAAVKLARAYTGRDIVAICGDQPFFSTDDWFIGPTAMGAGIPAAVSDLTVKFRFNDLESLRQVFTTQRSRIACVVLEAATAVEPRPGFLEGVRDLCRAEGALLIFDEMITGFRWHLGGAQRVYDVTPDLSCFGKALGNGFPIAALAGRRDVMERGGLRHSSERVFLLSTTHGAETGSLAAMLETMRTYRRDGIIERLHRQGERLRAGVTQVVSAAGLGAQVGVLGRACNLVFFTRDAAGQPSQPFRALFMQELIRHGVLAPSFVVSAAHSDTDIDRTITAVERALSVYARGLADGPEAHLVGRPVKPVLRTYN